jgi:hypothetical protein
LNNVNNAIALSAIYDHLSLAAIGQKYDLTRERVRQILKQLGIDYHVVLLREQNRQRAYKEAMKAARAYYATTLPDGSRRPEYEGEYASGRAKYSIQRINGDGNYEPGNCKWADQKEQCANRRKPQRNEKVKAPVMPGVYDTRSTGQQAYL